MCFIVCSYTLQHILPQVLVIEIEFLHVQVAFG